MQLLSVNVSMPQAMDYRGQTVSTGIFKQPVAGRRMVRKLNIDGDGQADLQAHGGPYKAVYAYPHEHYATWASELGRADFSYGQFGENLTITGILETDICVGDVLRVGGAVLQVTQPRVPCFKLETKMGIPQFQKRFLQSLRSGFYLRVLAEGEIGAGDALAITERDPHQMSVRDVNHLLYMDKQDVDAMRRVIEIDALPPGWKGSFEKLIAKLTA